MRKVLHRVFAALLLAAALLPSSAAAQYPSRPIRFIVGFPPGGSADPTARLIGQALSEQIGQPVIVENRPGADSTLAAEQVTRMAPDGYTIFYGSNSAMTAGVVLRQKPPYDPLADFTPIAMVGRTTIVLYVHPSVPAKSAGELVAYAKANPGKLNYGTGNPLAILAQLQLAQATGIDMQHVPYKGEGPVMPDLLTGRLHMSFLSNPAGMTNAKDGKLRALAVLHSSRAALLPDVPTIDEAGLPQITVRQWAGVFGPPKMPREIVERLNKEISAAVRRKEVIEKMQTYAYVAEGSTPEGLAAINRDDLALWRRLVKESGIPLD